MIRKKLKIIGLITPILLLTILGSMSVANETKAAYGMWHTIDMDQNLMWGRYVQSSGHYLATERYWNSIGVDGQSFWCGFFSEYDVPASYVTSVRIKFYIRDANTWWWANNEEIHISISSGSYNWGYDYDADDYPNGGYVYIYLGIAPCGHSVMVTYMDYSMHIGVTDIIQDCWYIDPPVIQYYSTITPT